MQIDINEILAKIEPIVREAGANTLPFFAQSKSYRVEYKDDNSPVTLADQHTELWLRKALKQAFPNFGIIGEEFGEDTKDTEYSWIIDPIDGTRAFITGVPLYTTLVGLAYTKTREPLAGCIYAPVSQEYICAGKDMGTFYNGNRVQVHECNALAKATALSYDWQRAYDKAEANYAHKGKDWLSKLSRQAGMARTWADGFGYMLLGSGKAHLIIDPSMHIWDLVPVYHIVSEAGGYIGTWNNSPIDWLSNDLDIVASSSKALLDLVHGA